MINLIFAAAEAAPAGNGAIVMSGIAFFLVLILGLVFALAFAGNILVPKGKVKLLINDNDSYTKEVERGATLLNALSAEGINIPSACGGGGSCALCLCHVYEGGGDVLPTEKSHLSLKQQKEGVRLACQVKVRDNMKLGIEEEIFGIQKWECEVVSNKNVATFIKEFIVKLPDGENLDFKAGGFIQIEIPKHDVDYKNFKIEDEYRGDWDQFNLWQFRSTTAEPVERAYSMANHPAEGNIVMLNVRIASPPPRLPNVPPGKASSYIFNLQPGDKVTISGPYGEFFMKDTDREIMFIGGGAGMAPMRSHIFDLFHTKRSDRKVSFWYGARSRREMFYDEDFQAIMKEFPNFKYYVALSDPQPEDNWTIKKDLEDTDSDGYTGFIHQVIVDNYLSKHDAPEEIEYYMCGPPMMNSAVEKMLDDMGVEKDMIAFDDFGS